MKKLKIDWNNLIDAYSSEQEDFRCYFDTNSGTVVWKSSEVMAKANQSEMKSGLQHLIEVPTISSREGWELMMDFIERVANPALKNKLMGSIQGKGAFRRFKDILAKSPHDQEQWFLYQDAAITKILLEWLVSINVESQNTPTYAIKVGERVRLEKPPFEQKILDQILTTADALIGNGDKTFLVQVLKGSKAKAIKEKNGMSLPGYGALSTMTIKDIDQLVDKTIQTNWLKMNETSDQEGLLEHSRKSSDRIKELWCEQLLDSYRTAPDEAKIKELLAQIMEKNREIRQHLLDVLFKKADRSFIPLIEAWKNEEVRKFKKRLQGLLRKLGVKQPVSAMGQSTNQVAHRPGQHSGQRYHHRHTSSKSKQSASKTPANPSPRSSTGE
ncbi:hypothetical protein JXQ70_03170 [bacterium]|nr:hypothetical protein [bacterium]